jgi:hypothetical protein
MADFTIKAIVLGIIGCFVVGGLLLVILLPMSFSYLDFYEVIIRFSHLFDGYRKISP